MNRSRKPRRRVSSERIRQAIQNEKDARERQRKPAGKYLELLEALYRG